MCRYEVVFPDIIFINTYGVGYRNSVFIVFGKFVIVTTNQKIIFGNNFEKSKESEFRFLEIFEYENMKMSYFFTLNISTRLFEVVIDYEIFMDFC